MGVRGGWALSYERGTPVWVAVWEIMDGGGIMVCPSHLVWNVGLNIEGYFGLGFGVSRENVRSQVYANVGRAEKEVRHERREWWKPIKPSFPPEIFAQNQGCGCRTSGGRPGGYSRAKSCTTLGGRGGGATGIGPCHSASRYRHPSSSRATLRWSGQKKVQRSAFTVQRSAFSA